MTKLRLDPALWIVALYLIASPAVAHESTVVTPQQSAYLKASNTGAGDRFGKSVAVSGNTMVIGAPLEASGVPGVNKGGGDDSMPGAGAVYVFVRDGASWALEAYLKSSAPGIDDGFGTSVAIDGDTIVVGAGGESSGAIGVDGDARDDSAPKSGAAYVFVRKGGMWTQQAYLKASNTDAFDHFGISVDIDGDTIVVGALDEASSASGVNGDDTDDSAPNAGAAYVFVRSGESWSPSAYLKALNPDAGDWFGKSVAISGDTIVVGCDGDDSAATGVNGDGSDDSAPWAGAAYVFVRNGGHWSQQAYLKPAVLDFEDYFGHCVAIDGDTIIVGALWEDSGATGVDGDATDNTATSSGAAYVFVRNGATWSQSAYLKPHNTEGGDYFGNHVDVSGDRVVASSLWDDCSATGVNAPFDDQGAIWSGAAYVYARGDSGWFQQAYLKASNTNAFDTFGKCVAIDGPTVVVGADLEDGSSLGVDGDQSDENAENAGAGYVFDFLAWASVGDAVDGQYGEPRLFATGSLAPQNANTIALTHAAPHATSAIFAATSSAPAPFFAGTLLAFPLALPPVVLPTNAAGAWSLTFEAPAAAPSGIELWVQCAVLDAAAPMGVALSNAVVGVVP